MIKQLAAISTITLAIKSLLSSKPWKSKTPYKINDGYCDEFAQAVIGIVGDGAQDVEMANFTTNNDDDPVFDVKMLKRYWPKCVPPKGYTWASLNALQLGGHVWITDNKKHYDAECPQGVENMFDLPFWKAALKD